MIPFNRQLYPAERIGPYLKVNGKNYIDFSSNDTLFFSQNTSIIEQCLAVLKKKPWGSGGSRLLGANSLIHHKFEKDFSILQGRSILLFNSGYHANIGILPALFSKQDIIFADKFIHASIIDGIRLSGAKLIRYKHNNLDHLKMLLETYRYKFKNALLITESIFSMDGDRAPINELISIKHHFKLKLYIDDAHGFGLYGHHGLGVSRNKNIDIIIGTFGKALGGYGAFVACHQKIKLALINHCRSFIYSTALPNSTVIWNYFAINYLLKNPSLLLLFHKKLSYIQSLFKSEGFSIKGNTHIIPILFSNHHKAKQCSNLLKKSYIWAPSIHFPTVPKNASRIRISINIGHSKSHIKLLIQCLKKYL